MAYSQTEKLIHRIGFHSLAGQELMSSMTDLLYASKIGSIPVKKPIFLTSLARSGTSLLLKLLIKSDQLVSHTYRDMPFLLCPLFWRNISSRFYVYSEEQERAHKDGLKINFDSEEAFEEILWKYFFKDHFTKNLIQPIDEECHHEEFEKFFVNHIRKIIFCERSSRQGHNPLRYVSKNNANFTRIPYISNIFHDAIFVIPVRNPVAHVRSLMNQHKNFLEIHLHDKFAKAYMNYLGHYEFGELFKRINIGKKNEERGFPWDLSDETFWVEYWCDVYQYLIDLSKKYKNIIFVSYENLCNDPENTLRNLFSRLELDNHCLQDVIPLIKACKRDEHQYSAIYMRAIDIYAEFKNIY